MQAAGSVIARSSIACSLPGACEVSAGARCQLAKAFVGYRFLDSQRSQQLSFLLQVARKDLVDDGEYEDIIDDITQEIQEKYGEVRQCHLPRPAATPEQVSLPSRKGVLQLC